MLVCLHRRMHQASQAPAFPGCVAWLGCFRGSTPPLPLLPAAADTGLSLLSGLVVRIKVRSYVLRQIDYLSLEDGMLHFKVRPQHQLTVVRLHSGNRLVLTSQAASALLWDAKPLATTHQPVHCPTPRPPRRSSRCAVPQRVLQAGPGVQPRPRHRRRPTDASRASGVWGADGGGGRGLDRRQGGGAQLARWVAAPGRLF